MSNAPFHAMSMILPLLQQAAAPIQPDLVAIICSGKLDSEEVDGSKSRADTRIYLIDEQSKDVAFYNPGLEAPEWFCRDRQTRCNFDFYPATIILNWTTEHTISRHLVINRKRGDLLEMYHDSSSGFTFIGSCSKTAVPTYDTSRNAF